MPLICGIICFSFLFVLFLTNGCWFLSLSRIPSSSSDGGGGLTPQLTSYQLSKHITLCILLSLNLLTLLTEIHTWNCENLQHHLLCSVSRAPVQGQVPVLSVHHWRPGDGCDTLCCRPQGVWGAAAGHTPDAGQDRPWRHDADDPPQAVSIFQVLGTFT